MSDLIEAMVWTSGTAMFVGFVLLALVGLSIYTVSHPPVPRKGFLPMETTGGDRLYVGLLGIGLSMITLIAFTNLMLPIGLVIGLIWAGAVLLWG